MQFDSSIWILGFDTTCRTNFIQSLEVILQTKNSYRRVHELHKIELGIPIT